VSAGCGGEPNAEADAAKTPAPLGCNGRGVDVDGLEVSGERGLTLRFESAEPMPPATGDNSWLVALEAEGEPLSGVAHELSVTPHMPDHGHGSPVAVEVTEQDAGVYRVAPINTFMPGYWQITFEVASEELRDAVEFGVCVE
jgi:hypothetical protein